ncbi:MAG: hypothetical protein K6F51_07875 [Acetatifactor sp.]|nr:hypothetical protein [Acetatifactor sp.]
MIMNVNRMHAKRIMVFWLGVILFITLCPMLPFRAKAAPREVRVGWHEEPYFIKDHNGRASGYSYEYQHVLFRGEGKGLSFYVFPNGHGILLRVRIAR